MYGLKNDFGEAVQLSKAQKVMILEVAEVGSVYTSGVLANIHDRAVDRTIYKLDELGVLYHIVKKGNSLSGYAHGLTEKGKDVAIELLLEKVKNLEAVAQARRNQEGQ
jgi:hypothetical protein